MTANIKDTAAWLLNHTALRPTSAIILGTAGVMYYLPVLLIAGTVAGALIGLAAAYLTKRTDIHFKQGKGANDEAHN